MIVLAVAGIAILIIIYLYVRSEGLRQEVGATKRQITNLSAEVKHLVEVTEILAFEQQIGLRKNLARQKSFGHPDAKTIKVTDALIEAIVNVTTDAAKGHKNVVEAFRKQLGRNTDISFEEFSDFIASQSDRIKMEWHKKSILGYYTVCRLLLDVLSGVSEENQIS